jgi:hypothetical protein
MDYFIDGDVPLPVLLGSEAVRNSARRAEATRGSGE